MLNSPTFTSKSPLVFISDPDQIKEFNGNLRSRIIVGGSLMIASLSNIAAPNGFVKQEISVKPKFSIKGNSKDKKKSSISVFFSREGLSELSARKLKGVSALDCALRYGYYLKDSDVFTVLLAFEGMYSTSIAALTFKNNSLIMYNDHLLSTPESSNFDMDLKVLLEKYSDSAYGTLHWAGSLEAPAGFKIVKAPHSMWFSVAPALSLNQSISGIAKYGVAVGIVITSILGAVGAVSIPYFEYVKNKEAYLAEDPKIKNVYKGDFKMIEVIKRRQGLLNQSPKKSENLDKFESIIRAVSRASQNAKISDIIVKIPSVEDQISTSASRPNLDQEFDYSFYIHAEAGNTSEIEQSKALITELSSMTGFSMRVVDTETDKAGSRLFKIQGEFK